MPKAIKMNGCTYEWFAFSKLTIKRQFQRKEDKAHIYRIRRNYHPDLADTPLVCVLPNGSLHVADGQHTLRATQAENPQATGMYCRVTTLPPDEAFVRRNSNKKAVTKDGQFWTYYGGGRPAPLAIERICNVNGIKLQREGTQQFGHVKCVARLLEFYNDLGEEEFAKIIRLLTQCFRVRGGTTVQTDALKASFLRGFFDFATKQPPRSTQKIKRALQDARMSAADYIDCAKAAKSSSTRHAAIAQMLCDICTR